MQSSPQLCSDCESFDRRSFLKTAGVATLAGIAMPMFVGQAGLFAAPTAKSTAETAVGRFFAALSAEQKKAICFPFEHELRQKINANWHITKPKVGSDFFNKD